MQVINKITGKDITKELNDKMIQEIIASGKNISILQVMK